MTPVIQATTYSSPARETLWIRGIQSVERVAAFCALAILLPALIAVAITIALLSKRSPLVLHTRVGRNWEPLRVLKFRTMWEGGGPLENPFTIHEVSDLIPTWKGAGDARVTSRFAAFCRRHSIDELPQLFHVVRGEMSLVGPRPITLGELKTHYGACGDEVLSILPGITGLWQVMGRDELSYARRRRLDVIFVRRRSARLYVRILLLSIPRVLSGAGAS